MYELNPDYLEKTMLVKKALQNQLDKLGQTAAQMLIVVAGANVVWTSPALIKLYSNDTQINPIRRPIKAGEVSMIAGIPSLISLAGTMMLPKLSDVLGRKKYLQLIGLGTLIAGIALAFSSEVIYIILSKSLLSFVLSGAWTIVPVYVAEICENHNRAKFGCFLGLFHEIGHFYAYVVGPLFSLKNFTLIITAPALLFLMIFIIVPESPIYLMSKGKEEECKEALRKFRNNKNEEELENDFLHIKKTLNDRADAKKDNVLDLFKKRENRFALMLALLPLLVQHFCGMSVIMAYLAPIFNAAGTGISGNIAAIIVSMVKYTNSALLDSLKWLPLLAVLCNVIIYSMGIGPVPMALISELFPSDLRAASSAVINTVVNSVVFGLTAGFPLISEAFGIHCSVWLFALCCFLGAVLIYFFIPETKAQMLAVVAGSNVVWTSPALLKLTSNDTEINPLGRPVTTIEISMIAGIPSLSALVGTMVLPQLADVIGRKKYLLLNGLGMLIAGVSLAFSTTIIYIIITKSFLSFFACGAWTILPVYVIEICEKHNRTKFGCFIGIFHQIGHCYVYFVGPLFSLRIFTLIILTPALVFLMIFAIVPDSPIYLLSKGKVKEGKEALRKFRNNKSEEELEFEFVHIKKIVKDRAEAKKATMLVLFRKRQNRIALILALLPLIVQNFCGISIIMAFLAPIFNAAGTNISGNIAAVIVSSVKISCFVFTSFVIDKFGRRRMLLISSAGTGVPFIALALYFYLKYTNSSLLDSLQWLPLIAMLALIIMYSVGLGPVPPALVNELFPHDLRAASSAIINTMVNIIVFSLNVSFPLISQAYGIHCCLWIFSSFCFIGAILIYLFLPETKGRSFKEIQEMLNNY
ncbi:unnamed protein product [Psylliodes chrysocephalus]|uniref:Facilitated trehalose transporter Tret1-like n=1 Tax=Psylliodes chrysocephalus TaxID=3402493 RepID=A0A9P0GJQ6_9CUCU|nr:unnamed protein product [Psylliodes chrysocephala]